VTEVRFDERQQVLGHLTQDPRQAVDREVGEHLTGLGRHHQREVRVVAQGPRREGDRADEQVVDRVEAADAGRQLVEELVELAHAQRLEQHVLATREQPVERRSRQPGRGSDVIDRDPTGPPLLAAGLGRIERPLLGPAVRAHGWRVERVHRHAETIRRKASHRQGSS
jgi:hypothetical protein